MREQDQTEISRSKRRRHLSSQYLSDAPAHNIKGCDDSSGARQSTAQAHTSQSNADNYN